MKDPESPTARYHREHYGKASYSDFIKPFEAGLATWDPDRWAAQFKSAGASYVVVTAKYADGYSMWPTRSATRTHRTSTRAATSWASWRSLSASRV